MSKSNIKNFFTYNKSEENKKSEEPEEENYPDVNIEEEETPEQSYKKFRNKHKRDNYVPITHIGEVFSHHFQNSTIIDNITDNIKLCKIKISDLLNSHIINWELNREPDEVRIPNIAQYIYCSRARIHTLFYLNYNFKNDRFELIDGSHRHWALKMLKSLSEENGIIIDERLRGEDRQSVARWFIPTESIDWLLNINIIAQINFISTNVELIKLRDDINSSRPMEIIRRPTQPEPDVEKYKNINEIADEYIHRYKKCFADSCDENYLRSKRKSNRDKFVRLLSNLYDKYNIDRENIGKLKSRLQIANDKIKKELEENKISCNQTIKDICHDIGCYLFLYRDDKLLEII
jgi:hypothetical protein